MTHDGRRNGGRREETRWEAEWRRREEKTRMQKIKMERRRTGEYLMRMHRREEEVEEDGERTEIGDVKIKEKRQEKS